MLELHNREGNIVMHDEEGWADFGELHEGSHTAQEIEATLATVSYKYAVEAAPHAPNGPIALHATLRRLYDKQPVLHFAFTPAGPDNWRLTGVENFGDTLP